MVMTVKTKTTMVVTPVAVTSVYTPGLKFNLSLEEQLFYGAN